MRVAILSVLVLGCGSVQETPDSPTAQVDGAIDGAAGVDAAVDAPPGARLVFVTSAFYTGDLGGLAGADQNCTNLANAVAIPGTYQAWLSDGTASGTPAARMNRSGGPFVLVNGAMIATSWADLTDGILMNAIDLAETGQPGRGGADCWSSGAMGLDVWSAVASDGGPAFPNVCQAGGIAWRSGAAPSTGGIGRIGSDSRWSDGGCVANCSTPAPLYCFQQ